MKKSKEMRRHLSKSRFIILALVLLFVLAALCGCGENKKPEGPGTEVTDPQSGSDDPSGNKDPEPVTDPEPEKDPEPEPQYFPDTSKAYIYENHKELTPVNYESPALLPLTEDQGQEYIDRLVWICDSPTYWLKGYGILKDGKNTTQIWTGPKGTLTFPYYKTQKLVDPYDGKERVMVELVKLRKPEILVMAVGLNGIAGRSEEKFTALYKQMILDIREASPDTVVIIQAMYPSTSDYKKSSVINPKVLSRGNSWMLKIAEETGCYYMDTFASILGDDGYAIKSYMKDGVHPNKAGLNAILQYIRTHAYLGETKQQ